MKDDQRMDIGCEKCDAMQQDATEDELVTEGWVCVNGIMCCPDCVVSK